MSWIKRIAEREPVTSTAASITRWKGRSPSNIKMCLMCNYYRVLNENKICRRCEKEEQFYTEVEEMASAVMWSIGKKRKDDE